MKKLLLLAFISSSLIARSQAVLTLSYAGAGAINVKNAGTCNAEVRIEWPTALDKKKDTTVLVAAGTSRTVILPGLIPGQIRIKSEGPCSSHGWTILNLISLPIPPGISARPRDGGVQLSVTEKGTIEKSNDGRMFYTIGTADSALFDPYPEASNYYRLRVDGRCSLIVLVRCAEKLYSVFTYAGALVGRTANISPYRSRKYIISR